MNAIQGISKAGHDFIEDEKRAILRAKAPNGFEEARNRSDVAAHFHDQARDLPVVLGKHTLNAFRVIETKSDTEILNCLRHTGIYGSLSYEPVMYCKEWRAFVVSNQVAPGYCTRKPNGGGIGVRTVLTVLDHVHCGEQFKYRLGNLDFKRSWP